MRRNRQLLHKQIVRILLYSRTVQVQRILQESRTDVLEVRAGRPEPPGHAAGGRRRHQISQCQGLLQQRPDLFSGVAATAAARTLERAARTARVHAAVGAVHAGLFATGRGGRTEAAAGRFRPIENVIA